MRPIMLIAQNKLTQNLNNIKIDQVLEKRITQSHQIAEGWDIYLRLLQS